MGNTQQQQSTVPEYPTQTPALSNREWDIIRAHIDQRVAESLDFREDVIADAIKKSGLVPPKEFTLAEKVKGVAIVLGIALAGGVAGAAVTRFVGRKAAEAEDKKEEPAVDIGRRSSRGAGMLQTTN